jgi:hypothetical protein
MYSGRQLPNTVIIMRVVKCNRRTAWACWHCWRAGRGATDRSRRRPARKRACSSFAIAKAGRAGRRHGLPPTFGGARPALFAGGWVADATSTSAGRGARLARPTIVDGERLVWIGSRGRHPPDLSTGDDGRIVSFATANGKACQALSTMKRRRASSRRRDLVLLLKDLGPKGCVACRHCRASGGRVRGATPCPEEAEPGVAAIAVAVREPSSGRTLGTASIAGPIVRLPPQRHAQIVKALNAAALELARAWPGAPPRMVSRNIR